MWSRIASSQKTSLSLEDQNALRDQVITEDSPGTILRDFETLLKFVGAEKPKVSGKHNLLPMDMLAELNRRLSRPLKIKLKRPQQKSYANINGLYLLLRATGLAQVERAAAKQILVLDMAVLEFWRSLNSTERYFNLLEAWLIRSTSEMIGERSGFFNPAGDCLSLLERIPNKGLKIAGNRKEEERLSFFPGLHSIALLELFGLISVEHGEPEEGKGWRIISIHSEPFGKVLLKLAMSVISSDEFWHEFEEEQTPFGQLQVASQPYFPEWRSNLVLPETEFRDGTYIFKVSLGRAWRRISIRGETYLDDLADVILHSFNFDRDHLYRFTYKNRFGVEAQVNHPYIKEDSSTNETRIGDLPIQTGEQMIFLFDFGDNWEFDVEMERIDKVDPKMKNPRILEKHGKAPEQYPKEDDKDEW